MAGGDAEADGLMTGNPFPHPIASKTVPNMRRTQFSKNIEELPGHGKHRYLSL